MSKIVVVTATGRRIECKDMRAAMIIRELEINSLANVVGMVALGAYFATNKISKLLRSNK